MHDIIGIDMGGTNLRAGLIQKGEIEKLNTLVIKKDGTANDIIDDLLDLIGRTMEPDVEGIGIGVPSTVDTEGGIVYDVQNIPQWKEVPLKNIIESKFHIPVYVNNDANCFAVGEKHYGQGQNHKNMVGLITGTGFGAGLIIDGRLYSGENCGAGEFGMLPYRDGILEDYCSGQFFEKFYHKSGEDLALGAYRKEESAIQAFRAYGHHLGNGIKAIMYALDPEIIIIGGSVSNSFDLYKDSMYQEIKTFAYGKSAAKIEIVTSKLEHVSIFGAAALYIDAALK